ncbi:basic amino acid ABC transporter substrate-binding protein [Paludibacterium denitrificans]|uniref:Transporter substrate-binding domain-containing protein n=1 Tax=Paludibacterium denitrificans TaxID=2675226 RepID=A0A844GGX7_9NEIS|nr:basic amino acid ABC transporter substrate-binding protein [Paludibacterium denitrificans]MTD33924.1 transporter substrate-binding domain-containing protein [Paludibacterium denitrificans]
MKQSRRMLLASVLLATVAVTACGKKTEQASASAGAASTPAASAAKEYVVGTDATYAPFEFQNDKKEIVGFDIDVLSAVAAKAGFKVKFVNTPWEGIFSTLQQGDRDILTSAITITDERKQSMDFSDPYFEARQLIAVAKGVSDIKTFQDLKAKKVAVQTGTTGDDVVKKLLGKTSSNIKRFESMPLALKELESGGVQAAVGDNGVVINYVKNNPQNGISVVADDKSFSAEFYGFAVKKGNKELLAKINSGLKAIKADGTYDSIYAKYFGAKK